MSATRSGVSRLRTTPPRTSIRCARGTDRFKLEKAVAALAPGSCKEPAAGTRVVFANSCSRRTIVGGGGMLMASIDLAGAGAVLSDPEHKVQLRRAVIASTIGTAIEWYDFFLTPRLPGWFSQNSTFRIQIPGSAPLRPSASTLSA